MQCLSIVNLIDLLTGLRNSSLRPLLPVAVLLVYTIHDKTSEFDSHSQMYHSQTLSSAVFITPFVDDYESWVLIISVANPKVFVGSPARQNAAVDHSAMSSPRCSEAISNAATSNQQRLDRGYERNCTDFMSSAEGDTGIQYSVLCRWTIHSHQTRKNHARRKLDFSNSCNCTTCTHLRKNGATQLLVYQCKMSLCVHVRCGLSLFAIRNYDNLSFFGAEA